MTMIIGGGAQVEAIQKTLHRRPNTLMRNTEGYLIEKIGYNMAAIKGLESVEKHALIFIVNNRITRVFKVYIRIHKNME